MRRRSRFKRCTRNGDDNAAKLSDSIDADETSRLMNFSAAIAPLESALGDPGRGLPEEVFLFASRIMPLINVDLLIQEDGGRTLLTWRDDESFGQGWHIPGGIIRYKQTTAERIRACARQELGAEVTFDAAPLLVSGNHPPL